jgi:hypothetical protein
LNVCGDEANAGDRIQACSNLLGGNALALAQGEASRNRGSAFTDLEQYDLAIADETKAVELDAWTPPHRICALGHI